MIHKLRRKFILINMSLVTLVLLIVFGALCLSTYQSEKQANLSVLDMSLNRPENSYSKLPESKSPENKPDGNEPAGNEPPENQLPEFDSPRILEGSLRERMDSLKPCILIILDQNGQPETIVNEDTAFLERDDILQAVESIQAEQTLSSREPFFSDGLLSSMGLRYGIRSRKEQTMIALVDRSNELVALRNLSLSSLAVGAASLAAFFLISLFLSSLALRPVERAWMQQQQFIADASHELKTPLTIILANLGILQAHPEATIASQRQWLSNTQDEAKRMKKLVDDLLYLARSDAGGSNRIFRNADLSDAVWSALLPFESVAFERGLTLDSQIAPGLRLYGDAGQLKQLTAILLDNACKYSVKGTTVTVSLTREQSHCLLRVSNQGPVIAARDQEHLFERFYRSDGSRTRQAGGYGLGLAIAKSIVDSHKGKIFVERSDLERTVFCVQLPG